jgi:hypothetical protein
MTMHRVILGILLCLACAGCAFNRSDFVTGPDGRPQQEQMSDDGKTVGSVLRGLRPSAALRF